jgi:purine-binding chemotaxis protein CheW
MDDALGLLPDATGTDCWIGFELAGERYALPMASIEAVAEPPAVAAVPHAPPALLGVANFSGQIVPILDLAYLLDRRRDAARYDGGGEIMRLRAPEGSIGLWVDRVDWLIFTGAETADPDGVTLLDPAAIFEAALAPCTPPGAGTGPLGNVAHLAATTTMTVEAEAFIVVEAAGRSVRLPRDTVLELVEAVPWSPLPRAPAGLLGIAVLRDEALPLLSLATLLGSPAPGTPGGFAVIDPWGARALLAVDRVVGLRLHRRDVAATLDDSEPVDIAAALPEELRRIVLGFAPGPQDRDDPAAHEPAVEYLSFTVAGQDFAVPVACVDRVVAEQPLVALPPPGEPTKIIGVIELSGTIVPVAVLQDPAGGDALAGWTPGAYVIVRGPDGLGGIAADRIKRVVALRADQLAPPPPGDGFVEALTLPDAGEALRIIAPARVWSMA